MDGLYVGKESLNESIEYFRSHQYTKPEQIGLFFYFKGVGLSGPNYLSYDKWGNIEESRRAEYLRNLYDLAGVYDAGIESGGKRTALFPFSICDHYKSSAFYNGATNFIKLGSRISDTIDNALTSTFMQRNNQDPMLIRLANDYVEILKSKYLKGQTIPLELMAAWTYRFIEIEMPQGSSDEDFQDICILAFLKRFCISRDEFIKLFTYGTYKIYSANQHISGPDLRDLLGFNKDGQEVKPEVKEPETIYGDQAFVSHLKLSKGDVEQLLNLRGDELTREQIITILDKFDKENNQKSKKVLESTYNFNFSFQKKNFVTGFHSKYPRNLIVFGAPGTGKSFMINKAKESLLLDGGEYERVTFYPDYSYSKFVGTYKPVSVKDEKGKDIITYSFVPGPFMRLLAKALKNARTTTILPYLLIIEEINRANAASVFGDVFQLLDRDSDNVSEYSICVSNDIKSYLEKELGTPIDNSTSIRIPDNMFIWATMNSADQGVFPMDTAFKRRWDFKYIGVDDNQEKVNCFVELIDGKPNSRINWNSLRKAINEKLLDVCRINEDKLLGPYFLSKKIIEADESGNIINQTAFREAFKNKVIMYLYEDAARQYRAKLFKNDICKRYSTVCTAFDEIGMNIFGDDFQEEYYNQQEGKD